MSYSAPETLFSLLPKAKTPWTEFVFSTATQAAAVAFLVWVRLLYPTVVSPPEHTFRSVQLVSTPVPVNHRPQPLPDLPKPAVVAQLEAPTNALRLPSRQPKAPAKAEVASAPTVSVASRKLEPLPLDSAPVIPKQAVKTNVFSTGSSATPTIARAPSQVQTGGFGDPNGIPAKNSTEGKAVNIAARGSFDLPAGPGYGNGTGGAKGAVGVVASSGFGSGTATENSRGRVSAAAVQSGGFASADVPAPPTVRSRSAEPASHAVPAEIISKPTPLYTQEAKSLRIEGEVQLEVVLQASGSLRVLRVVRGLGHGLDDNAVKAAQQIHFKPAMRDGQPADSTVVLHIVFQLA
jgi:TonB family protein